MLIGYLSTKLYLAQIPHTQRYPFLNSKTSEISVCSVRGYYIFEDRSFQAIRLKHNNGVRKSKLPPVFVIPAFAGVTALETFYETIKKYIEVF